jgi:hypothetical protein
MGELPLKGTARIWGDYNKNDRLLLGSFPPLLYEGLLLWGCSGQSNSSIALIGLTLVTATIPCQWGRITFLLGSKEVG